MDKQRIALFAGTLLAIFGTFLAVRSIVNTRATVSPAETVEVPESVRLMLSSAEVGTVTTPENVGDVSEELRRRVLERIGEVSTLAGMPEEVRADLAKAFVERWRALVDPDVNRDHQTLAARGDPRSLSDAAKEFEDYRSWLESLSMSPIGLDGIIVTDGADLAALSSAVGVAGFEGFRRGASTRNTHKMPVPDSPSEAGWRSVQIVMPFEKQPMRGKGFGVAFLGFQFAWSAQRRQWVPYSTVWYVSPGEIHAAAPFR